MKKALAGPAKRTAKKKPERRAMIAAAGRRLRAAPRRTAQRLRAALPALAAATRGLDRAADRQLRRAWPALARAGRLARSAARGLGRRLRPLGVLLFRALAWLERRLLGIGARGRRGATRASSVLTPRRAICLAIVGAAGCLIAAQFVEYRAVEVGQPGYAGLPAASAPTVGAETAGQAHAYLLLPVALLAAVLALVALRNERRRGLGRLVFALGLLSLAIVLLVDLPAGLDVGAEASRFAGARSVLYDGFYAEIAAAAGLMLGGMLLVLAPRAAARYHARPCRTRTNSFARAASALRRRPRRRDSSRRRGARRRSRRRNGAVSAPASPR
jgi:hypothetical protein